MPVRCNAGAMPVRCDAMRCDAMPVRCRCDAMRCDAMRCDAMRCDAMPVRARAEGSSPTYAMLRLHRLCPVLLMQAEV